MAKTPRPEYLGVGFGVSHSIRPTLVHDIDRYIAVDIRPVGDNHRRPANRPACSGFASADDLEISEMLLDCLQQQRFAQQDYQSLREKAFPRHLDLPWRPTIRISA
jgi:hypothetical protein